MFNRQGSISRLINTFIFKNKPLYVHYGITHRCNLYCRMCRIYQDGNEQEELSLAQIDKIFGLLRRLGIIYVSIGGGEPFLRADLPEVIRLLRKKGFTVRLLTNGTLVDEGLIKELVSVGLTDVSISLDTLDSKKQDYIYHYKGAFDKVMRSINLFAEIIPKNGRLLLINTVVSALNIKELPELSQFAKRENYYISFVPIESNSISEFSFRADDYKYIDESYDYLIGMKRQGRSSIFNSSLFLEKSRQYLKSNKRNWQCDAGRLYYSLNPKGELSICHRFKPSLSLLSGDLKAHLFTLKAFKNKQKNLISECPGCMRPCWAEVSFLLQDKRSLWELAQIKFSSWNKL